MTTRARMLALIDAFKDEPPLIREIAPRVVRGFEREDAMEDDDATFESVRCQPELYWSLSARATKGRRRL
jgi:hypothetical protein